LNIYHEFGHYLKDHVFKTNEKIPNWNFGKCSDKDDDERWANSVAYWFKGTLEKVSILNYNILKKYI
jgi:hypothetical protein